MKVIRITVEVFRVCLVIVINDSGFQVSECSLEKSTILVNIVEIHKSIKQLSKHKVL